MALVLHRASSSLRVRYFAPRLTRYACMYVCMYVAAVSLLFLCTKQKQTPSKRLPRFGCNYICSRGKGSANPIPARRRSDSTPTSLPNMQHIYRPRRVSPLSRRHLLLYQLSETVSICLLTHHAQTRSAVLRNTKSVEQGRVMSDGPPSTQLNHTTSLY